MKYVFEARIYSGDYKKVFKTREKANKYLGKFVEDNNLEVEDIINQNGNKHNVEFICDDYNRIVISRI